MKVMVLAVVLMMAGAAMGQTTQPAAKIPDLSKLDEGMLRTLASNLYRRIATLEKQLVEVAADRDSLGDKWSTLLKEAKAIGDSDREKLRAALIAKLHGDRKAFEAMSVDELVEVATTKDQQAGAKLVHDANIKSAIKERRLAIGMTLAQAEQSMGYKGRKTGMNSDGAEDYQWILEHTVEYVVANGTRPNAQNSGVSKTYQTVTDAIWYARVENGLITDFQMRKP